MNIQPIVEGHGEIAAVPVLLRRLRDEAQAFGIDVNRPIRRPRSRLVDELELRRSVQVALLQPHCRAIFVLLDADRDCPAEIAPQVQQWAEDEASGIPCAVVLATKEYEAWFLASMESLRGVRGIKNDAQSHHDPESPRGAKAQLEARMNPGRSYIETADQAALTQRFDMRDAYRRCRSFRKFVKCFGALAAGMGAAVENWPPPAWKTSA